MTLPDLTATLEVTGAVNASYNFTNPENGGSNVVHGMICNFSSGNNLFAISGLNTAYTYAVACSMPGVQTGTFSITSANYGHIDGSQTMGFPELLSGSINITSAQVLWSVGASTVYSVSGSWSVTLTDGENPPSTITFTGQFTNLAVTAS